jgi:hypothetical protein
MSFTSCAAHSDYARESCTDCLEARTRPPAKPFRPERNLVARAYRQTYRNPPADDGAAYDITVDLDEDGEVHFRPATMADQLDRIVVKWIWEHQHRWLGGEVD